jgi:hypothetical protein
MEILSVFDHTHCKPYQISAEKHFELNYLSQITTLDDLNIINRGGKREK